MLLSVVNAKNVDQFQLVYLAIPIELIERDDVIFSNASANTAIPPDFLSDPNDLDQLNWGAIESLDWSLGTTNNQARMAEVLIHRRIDIGEVDHIVVWNAEIKAKVERIFAAARVEAPEIRFEGPRPKYHYFTGFYEGSKSSIVTGPFEIKLEYGRVVSAILAKGPNAAARFANTSDLLVALRTDLASLPETFELVGLESENDVHKENVGDHTLSVVRTLTASDSFAALDDEAKRITELAAFLHDIGKGPKARWASKGGKQQVDANHPIKSAKMLMRILAEEIRQFDENEVRILAKLVCYHDLVGEIFGKGRQAEQLEDIVESERELDMLIALGMADMQAVNSYWYYSHRQDAATLRQRVINHLVER